MKRPIAPVLLLVWLMTASCASGSGRTAGQGVELARQSLIQFFEYLNDGMYEEAAGLYGGTYEVMISHNEDVDPVDRIALWGRACTMNGAQCLRVRSATLQEQISPTEYVFLVEFEYDDGTLFVQGPCCGADETQQPPRSQFPYRVARQPRNDFVVLDMPIYLP